MAVRSGREAGEWLRETVDRNRQQEHKAIYSVCSAHPRVLEAAVRHARDKDWILCIESTSNQVNQFGGYTGQSPAQFASFVAGLAGEAGFGCERILLGGDHLGPYPWRAQPSHEALQKGCELVRACVLAGYGKIHLDASMACADDLSSALGDELVAQRAAELCAAAEDAWSRLPSGSPPLVYVIGTEVPVPGGETSASAGPLPTTVEHMEKTLEASHAAFVVRGLSHAWDRVIGLVVQTGAEFGDAVVYEYQAENARMLARNLPTSPRLVYEAHSTDYQTPEALREMVRDHFAILKVGPWLTFAYREAIFALGAMEKEWLSARKDVRTSDIPRALDQAMLSDPTHWKAYYPADEQQARFARRYSFSDRCRYYWPEASVQEEVDLLMTNLSGEIPLTLVSQYLPLQYEEIREGRLPNRPASLVESRIRQVLDAYLNACGGPQCAP
jgi:D-tagatose-1,6-bisphosphate aldolase subunit GatZ/KbaZ